MTNAFERLQNQPDLTAPFKQPVEAITPPSTGNAFDRLKPDLTPVIEQAIEEDPDKAARIQNMSRLTGVPVATINEDPETFEKNLSADKMKRDLAGAPVTSQMMADINNATIAHDDVSNLVELEKKWIGGKLGVKRREIEKQDPNSNIPLDVIRALGAGALYVPYGVEAAGTAVSRLVGVDTGQPVLAGQTSAERMQGWRQLIDDTLGEQKALMPEVSQGIVSAGQTLASLLTKAPLTTLAGSAGGAEAENAAQQGAGPVQSFVYGASQAAVEALTEKLPLEHLMKALKYGDPFFQTLVKQLALENVTEQVATAWQDMNEWLMLNPEKSAGEYLEERPNAALQTLISTTVGASVQTAISTAVVNAVRDDTAKADQAIETADYLDALKKTYDLSLLRQRAPEVFVQHQVKVLERSGVDTVYIDSDAFADYGWKTDPETGPMALAKQFGLDPEAVDMAITQGTDISLTREQFVRNVMMSEDYADIAPNIRFSPDAMTKRLAEEYKKSGIKEEAERALSEKPFEVARKEAFDALASAQRGDPEVKMLGVQRANRGGGVLSGVVEHIGDLTHRMSENFEFLEGSPDTVLSKVEKTLGALTSGYGFEKEHLENINSNANYYKLPPEQIKADVDAALEQYANAHLQLRTYNHLQQAAKEAAIAVGRQHWDVAIAKLEYIKESITAGKYKEDIAKFNQEDLPITLAEDELGLQGLFTSAAEAGMTSKEFTAYLRKVEAARVESVKRQKDKVLKEELRKNDAEWKTEWAKVEEQVKAELGSQQVYQAINNIQRDRLDQKAIRFTFHELVEKGQTTKEEIDTFLEMLPEDAKGRKLYTPTGQEGIDPQVWAEQHGYESAIEMLMDMMTVPDFQDAVRSKTQGIMDAKFGSLKDARQALVEARESLHNEDKGDMLTLELNALRGAKKGGSLKPALIRQAARDNMGKLPVKEISPNKFLAAEKREGRKAGMALRRGVYDKATKKWSKSDRKAAADAKFRQVLNFFMAKEAYKAERKVARDTKYLKKFLNRRKKFPNLPADSLDVIREILADYRLGPKVAAKKKRDLAEWAAKQSSITGTPMTIPPRIAAEDGQKYYKEMKLDEFGELVETIRQIEHAGKTEGQFLDAFRKQGVNLTVSDIKGNMLANLKQHKVDRESRLQKEGQLSAYITMVSNADTLLREIDGWEYGVTYDAIKRPYDRAYSEGYHPGQKGFAARDKAISQELTKLFGVFSRKERASMDDKLLVPGVKEPISHAGILSVLLNSGNSANIRALVEPSATAPGMFTMAEVRAIHQYASQKDWDFAQKAWDYLDSFWPEIEEAERRRKGFAPEKVEATPIQTPYGTYRGGYYPLRYDGDVQDVQSKSEIDAFVEQARFGQFVASHTRRGHTVERVGSGGKRIKLDLFVLHSHLHQVAYDLEVGDAINDIYKVLYNPALKQQFTDMGQRSKLEELQLWFGDIVTGELRLNNRLERNLRWLRTGFTVSKLGWNIANALVQPLGLSNTAAIVGKRNTLWALMQVMHNPTKWRGKGSVFQEIMDKSGFMRLRDDTWHKDINDAMDVLSTTWAAKHSPEWLREFGRVSTFLLTKKAQRFADTVTWLAGYRKGIKTYKGNEKKAVEEADRMVARSQSSGIFGERTRLERGTISKNHRQTEVARSFTALASYFLAKTNVTIERTKQLKNPITHPAQFTNYLIDMALIYVVEGLLASWWYWPDDEEGDGVADDMGWHVAGMALSAIANGLPLIREVSAAAQGYDTGGVIGATAGQAWRAAEQMWQVAKDGPDQFDIHLFKQLNNLGGIFLHYPSSQINRTAGAVSKGASGEETNILEYVFGVKQND